MNEQKTTKRVRQAVSSSNNRAAKTLATLDRQTSDKSGIINSKAIELIQCLKSYRDINNPEFVRRLQHLAVIIALSKIKRLNSNDKIATAQNARTQRQICRVYDKFTGVSRYDKLSIAFDENIELSHKNSKDTNSIKKSIKDQKTERQLMRILADQTAYADGIELIQDIVVAIWEHIKKSLQTVNNDYTQLNDQLLLSCYKVVVPHLCIYKNGEQKPRELWQYRHTNGIREAITSVSRYNDYHRKISENTDPVSYYEIINTITDTDGTQYSDISLVGVGAYAMQENYDGNGKPLTTSVDFSIIEKYDEISTNAHLSKRENYVLKNWLDGKTIPQISDILNVKKENVEDQLLNAKIKIAKLFNVGFEKKDKLPQPIRCYQVEKTVDEIGRQIENHIYICDFDSIGQAAERMHIPKSRISENLNGKTKTTHGYIFKMLTENSQK